MYVSSLKEFSIEKVWVGTLVCPSVCIDEGPPFLSSVRTLAPSLTKCTTVSSCLEITLLYPIRKLHLALIFKLVAPSTGARDQQKILTIRM